ncbi:hypothetical protein E2C01_045374 [Portunus trituberculatus]|uniref:Uncharacterized protein n=1 Tax=Portunus trituberculatus TaxID=210409 RepID=A0A5B7G228_PORTR|nr:hypothetical protein [Portunus trituberculatus]
MVIFSLHPSLTFFSGKGKRTERKEGEEEEEETSVLVVAVWSRRHPHRAPCPPAAAAAAAAASGGCCRPSAVHRRFQKLGEAALDCMVGYFQVFFVDTLCSGLAAAATPNQTLLDGGLRAKVLAGGAAGATLASGWRRLTQCPIGQNLNQRAPTWRVPRSLRRYPFALILRVCRTGRGARDGAARDPGAAVHTPRRRPGAEEIQNKTECGGARRAARGPLHRRPEVGPYNPCQPTLGLAARAHSFGQSAPVCPPARPCTPGATPRVMEGPSGGEAGKSVVARLGTASNIFSLPCDEAVNQASRCCCCCCCRHCCCCCCCAGFLVTCAQQTLPLVGLVVILSLPCVSVYCFVPLNVMDVFVVTATPASLCRHGGGNKGARGAGAAACSGGGEASTPRGKTIRDRGKKMGEYSHLLPSSLLHHSTTLLQPSTTPLLSLTTPPLLSCYSPLLQFSTATLRFPYHSSTIPLLPSYYSCYPPLHYYSPSPSTTLIYFPHHSNNSQITLFLLSVLLDASRLGDGLTTPISQGAAVNIAFLLLPLTPKISSAGATSRTHHPPRISSGIVV